LILKDITRHQFPRNKHMKNLSFPQSLFLFTVCVLLFSNCRNRPEMIDPTHILGKWDVDTYQIDSEEQIGTVYNSVNLNFGEISDGVGPFALVTEDINGSSNSQGGEYSLDIDFTKIYLTLPNETVEYLINFDEDNLMMEGTNEDNKVIKFHCNKVE